jgi:ethanolamine utilization protein EutN
MKLGIVRGHVVLNVAIPCLRGTRLVIVEPVTAENLAARNGAGGGKPLIAVDQLAAAEGQMVAFTEGREAANPYWPNQVPVDAYCALIVDGIDFRPPAARHEGSERAK